MAFLDDSTREDSEKMRLEFDDLASSIVARIEHRDDEGLKVKQALPFLKIDSAVYDESGRKATIRGVDVSVENGTPNLVLDLAYEGIQIGDGLPAGLDDTLRIGVVIAPRRTGRTDNTIPFGFSRRSPRKARTDGEPVGVACDGEPDSQCYLLTQRKEPEIVVVEPERFQCRDREPAIVIPPEDLIVPDDWDNEESPLKLDGLVESEEPLDSRLDLGGVVEETDPIETPLKLQTELDWAPLTIGGRARALAKLVWESVVRSDQSSQR